MQTEVREVFEAVGATAWLTLKKGQALYYKIEIGPEGDGAATARIEAQLSPHAVRVLETFTANAEGVIDPGVVESLNVRISVPSLLIQEEIPEEQEAIDSTATVVLRGQVATGPFVSGISGAVEETQTTLGRRSDRPEMTSVNVGAAAAGVTAFEYGDAYTHTTVLLIDSALPAIAGDEDLAVGIPIYTFPDGALHVPLARATVAVFDTEGNIVADTPEVGVGTTLASGAVDVLGGTAGFEDIVEGAALDDCDGTQIDVAEAPALLITTDADHDVFLNFAAAWTEGGAEQAQTRGTVVLRWDYLGE